MDLKKALHEFKKYAAANDCVVKVYGDYAYRSKRYQQNPPRGRIIKLKGIKDNQLIIFDSKKGIVSIEIR